MARKGIGLLHNIGKEVIPMKKIAIALTMLLTLSLGLTACTSRKPDAPAKQTEAAQEEKAEEKADENAEGAQESPANEAAPEESEAEDEALEYDLDLNDNADFGIYVVRDAQQSYTVLMTYEGQTETPKEICPSNEEFEMINNGIVALAQNNDGTYDFHVAVKNESGEVVDEKDFTYDLEEEVLFLVILGDGTIWDQDEAEDMV